MRNNPRDSRRALSDSRAYVEELSRQSNTCRPRFDYLHRLSRAKNFAEILRGKTNKLKPWNKFRKTYEGLAFMLNESLKGDLAIDPAEQYKFDPTDSRDQAFMDAMDYFLQRSFSKEKWNQANNVYRAVLNELGLQAKQPQFPRDSYDDSGRSSGSDRRQSMIRSPEQVSEEV